MTGAGAVARTAEVVDDDAGALLGKLQRVHASQPTSGSGDDDDAILHSWHWFSFLAVLIPGASPALRAWAQHACP
ncbi:hypothetical protein MAGR_47450 [Mycolicibacterium agri]|uniref:Uncharacterized protein n=1 Tax=Mycolicibacterium agri TaxID=36811 RepID=A0A7I9W6I1_MYCAG|nr:hypothetical protein MAGR_47450 [Mycolicibacterium agri]